MKIKTVHIITRLDKGGSAENTLLTITGLDKEIYNVILLKGLSIESNIKKDEERAIEKSVREAERDGIKITIVTSLVRNISLFYDLKAFFALFRILRHERPHVVHTHTSKAGILGRWAAFFSGVPIIIHTPHGHVFWGYFNKWKISFYIILEKLTARITNKIIALTLQEKNDHIHYHIASRDKFSVVHSGINLEKFSKLSYSPAVMKKKLGISEGNLVVGTVGRLTQVKGHRYLIEAARKILDTRQDITFVFVGDGELLDYLLNTTSMLSIQENVKFIGWRQDVAEVMSVFDVFVLPSLNEGMGRVLAEAMVLGKPIVASDVGGIPDLVVHGENGYLFPVGKVDILTKRVLELLDDPLKREEMGNRGRSYAIGYSSKEMVTKIDLIYRHLLREKDIMI